MPPSVDVNMDILGVVHHFMIPKYSEFEFHDCLLAFQECYMPCSLLVVEWSLGLVSANLGIVQFTDRQVHGGTVACVHAYACLSNYTF